MQQIVCQLDEMATYALVHWVVLSSAKGLSYAYAPERYIGFVLILLSLALSILGIITGRTAIPLALLCFVVGLVLMWRGRH